MGLKENLEAVKKELSTEEQFLEGFIKAEGFFKKYKKLLVLGVIAIVITILGYALYSYMQEKNLNISNQAYDRLQSEPTNKEDLEILKSKNAKLYQLFIFTQGMKSANFNGLKEKLSDPILLDLLSYQVASSSEKDLASYSLKQNATLKDFARLQEAYILLKDSKTEEAKTLLLQIPENSSLQQFVKSLSHYNK